MAFRMNRPIIKGSALHKSSQNIRVNPNDLRETPKTPFRQDDESPTYNYTNDVSFNKRGEGLTEEELNNRYKYNWYDQNRNKRNFGYKNLEDFRADYPEATKFKHWKTGQEIWGMDSEIWAGHNIEFTVPEKLIKIPPRSIEQMPTSEMDDPKKIPPYDLVKNRSSHFTIQRQGVHSGTYPKGEDGRALIKLKDKSGGVVWKGSQTEYEEKYGDWLERGDTEYGERKNYRLYLRDQEGVSLPPSKTVFDTEK